MSTRHDPSPPIAHWPPFLTTRRAIAYTGRSRTTIARAIASGALAVYSRPGGVRGERVFRLADLDRWMSSTPVDAPQPATPAATPQARHRRAAGPDIATALESIDATRRVRR